MVTRYAPLGVAVDPVIVVVRTCPMLPLPPQSLISVDNGDFSFCSLRSSCYVVSFDLAIRMIRIYARIKALTVMDWG